MLPQARGGMTSRQPLAAAVLRRSRRVARVPSGLGVASSGVASGGSAARGRPGASRSRRGAAAGGARPPVPVPGALDERQSLLRPSVRPSSRTTSPRLLPATAETTAVVLSQPRAGRSRGTGLWPPGT